MAWTAPRTWTDGEAVTSAMFNTHVRDLFRHMADEPHECWVERTTNVSITTNTRTTVAWEQVTRNVGVMWKATNADRVTIQQEGVYAITMNSQWATGSTGYTCCNITVNGTTYAGQGDDATAAHNQTQQRSCHIVLELQVGDIVRGEVTHNNGSDLTLQGGISPGTHLKVVQVQRRLV